MWFLLTSASTRTSSTSPCASNVHMPTLVPSITSMDAVRLLDCVELNCYWTIIVKVTLNSYQIVPSVRMNTISGIATLIRWPLDTGVVAWTLGVMMPLPLVARCYVGLLVFTLVVIRGLYQGLYPAHCWWSERRWRSEEKDGVKMKVIVIFFAGVNVRLGFTPSLDKPKET